MSTLASLASAKGGFEVTPHDTNPVTKETRALYVGSGGDIKVTLADGTVVTFPSVVAGSILSIRARIIWSTGTTASDMVGLY